MKTIFKKTPLLFITAFTYTFLVSADLFNPENETERDIQTVTIGKQVWMAQNMGTTEFRNGESIPLFKGYEDWSAYGSKGLPACGRENFNPADAQKYGLLYNWYAVTDPRGLCPKGFRIPTEDDFIELLIFIGGNEDYDSEKALALLSDDEKGFGLWFNGSCCMDYEDEDGVVHHFINRGYGDSFWSSTESDGSEFYLEDIAVSLELGSSWFTDTYGAYLDPTSSKWNANSVRCIRE